MTTDRTIPIRDGGLAPHDRRVFDDGAGGLSPVNAEHPEQRAALLAALAAPVAPLNSGWSGWSAAAVFDARNYAAVEIQVTAQAAATVTRSGNNVDYVPISAKVDGVVTPVAALGFYSLKGGGYLKWAGTGTILVRGYN